MLKNALAWNCTHTYVSSNWWKIVANILSLKTFYFNEHMMADTDE